MGNPAAAQLDWQCSTFDELSNAALYNILALRQQVFVIEQNCLYQDMDNLDQRSLHLSAWRGQELMAYLRALPPGCDYPESALGRIVVSQAARGMQLGRELVERGIALNLETWPGAGICIGAQSYLENFYQDLGFVTAGEPYDEDGIPHIKMYYRENP